MGSQTTMTAGVIAPAWLHESLGVLLQAAPGVKVWSCATSAEELLSAAPERPPNLVVLYISSRQDGNWIGEIKATWPDAHRIVLVEHPRYQGVAKQAGADVVLLQGLAPGRLLDALDQLRSGQGHNP